MATVNLVVIARNESRCIARCLQSAAAVVDEMIVLDTGSTDNTAALAMAAGARVIHFEWTGSFSEARNKSLELSQSDWNLVLDADEWIEDPAPWAFIRQMISDSAPFIGLIRVRNEIDLAGRQEIADTWIPRLLPKGVRYQGRIHEQPISRFEDRKLDLTVRHDGYRKDRAIEKHHRNHILLKVALQEAPEDAYLHFQMGAQFEVIEDWSSACDHYAASTRFGGAVQAFAHTLSFRHLHALARCKRYEQALELGLSLRERWPDSSDVHFAFGDVCLDLAAAEPTRAMDTWLPAAEAAWLRCLEIGEGTRHAAHVVGRGSHLAAHNLAVIYEGLGLEQKAKQYRRAALSGDEIQIVQETATCN